MDLIALQGMQRYRTARASQTKSAEWALTTRALFSLTG